MTSQTEIVTSTRRSQEITRGIMRSCQPIGVDIEGVRLSATGPLTLLQIVTSGGQAYIFDVLETRDLICIGGIKEVMENPDIVKVLHGCFNDSASLYHQFGVKLCNVFDTGMAHYALEYHRGIKFPVHLKLAELVVKYGGQVAAAKSLQDKWRFESDFWARRPLTKEMIEYAIGDVIMLFPRVYETLKREIDRKHLWEQFNALVDENVNEHIEPERVQKQRIDRKICQVEESLYELDEQYKGMVITERQARTLSEDAVKALWETTREQVNGLTPVVMKMRDALFLTFLSDIEAELRRNPRELVNKNLDRLKERRLESLEEAEGGKYSHRVKQILDQITQEKTKKILWKLNKGYTIGTWEKFAVFRVDLLLFNQEEKRKIANAKNLVAANVQKDLRGKTVEALTDTEKSLLKVIPEQYVTDPSLRSIQRNIPQD